MLSTSWSCLLEGITNLSLCEGFFGPGLGEDEREGGFCKQRPRGLGDGHREWVFLGEQRARGLGEEDTEWCFGEDEGVKCFGDVKVGKCFDELEKEMGEELEDWG